MKNPCWNCNKVEVTEKMPLCSFECLTEWMEQQFLDKNGKRLSEDNNAEYQ